jgi:hypothetical protein
LEKPLARCPFLCSTQSIDLPRCEQDYMNFCRRKDSRLRIT